MKRAARSLSDPVVLEPHRPSVAPAERRSRPGCILWLMDFFTRGGNGGNRIVRGIPCGQQLWHGGLGKVQRQAAESTPVSQGPVS